MQNLEEYRKCFIWDDTKEFINSPQAIAKNKISLTAALTPKISIFLVAPIVLNYACLMMCMQSNKSFIVFTLLK